MSSDPGAFTATYDEAASTWTLRGDADRADSTHTAAALDALWLALDSQAGQDVTVDLTEVTFLPSHTVGVLAVARNVARGRGGSLRLQAREGTAAHRVLQVMGLVA